MIVSILCFIWHLVYLNPKHVRIHVGSLRNGPSLVESETFQFLFLIRSIATPPHKKENNYITLQNSSTELVTSKERVGLARNKKQSS